MTKVVENIQPKSPGRSRHGKEHDEVHPGRLTAGTYKSPMKRKENDQNQTSMEFMFQPLIFQGCRSWFFVSFLAHGCETNGHIWTCRFWNLCRKKNTSKHWWDHPYMPYFYSWLTTKRASSPHGLTCFFPNEVIHAAAPDFNNNLYRTFKRPKYNGPPHHHPGRRSPHGNFQGLFHKGPRNLHYLMQPWVLML